MIYILRCIEYFDTIWKHVETPGNKPEAFNFQSCSASKPKTLQDSTAWPYTQPITITGTKQYYTKPFHLLQTMLDQITLNCTEGTRQHHIVPDHTQSHNSSSQHSTPHDMTLHHNTAQHSTLHHTTPHSTKPYHTTTHHTTPYQTTSHQQRQRDWQEQQQR